MKRDTDNKGISSEHFEGGKKNNHQPMPSIFPWTKEKENRRPLHRKELSSRQNTTRNSLQNASFTSTVISICIVATTTTNLMTAVLDEVIIAEENNISQEAQEKCLEDRPMLVDQGIHSHCTLLKINSMRVRELNFTIERLIMELKRLQNQPKETKFNIRKL